MFAGLGRTRRRQIGLLAVYAILTAGGCMVALPFLWMLTTALKPASEIFLVPVHWIPTPVLLSNFAAALREVPFGRYFRNTAVITLLATFGSVFSSSLVAYAFARLRWPGRDALFLVVLMTLMLPHQVMLVPKFLLFRAFGWINTFYPLIVPFWFGVPFSIFLLRQFYLTLPAELDDAARIDGCSWLGIYWRIVLPLCQPALATIALMSFHAHWDDLIDPLIYLHSARLYTVSLGLLSFRGEYNTQWNYLMAASLVVMLPVLAAFYVLQRYFLRGISIFAGINR